MSLTFPMAALVKREFISLIRAPRSFVFLMLFLAVCIVAVAWMWPAQERIMTEGSLVSQMLITGMTTIMLVACALFVPALGATSIVVEREQDTLDALRTTLIRPSGIILGKLLNTVGFFLLLLVAALPVASTVFFLFGLDWSELLQILISLLLFAVACAMIGIYCSARFQRTYVAIGASYAGVLIMFFGASTLGTALVSLLPLVLLGAPMRYGRPMSSIVLFGGMWGMFSSQWIFLVIFSVVCYFLALRQLRKPPAPPKVENFKPIDDPAVLRKRRTTWPFYLIDPMARRKPVEDGRNPMLVRELRWGMTSRGTFLARVYLIAFAISLFSSFPAAMDIDPSAAGVWFAAAMVIIVGLAPVLLANALTKEYELGNIDMLRMTLLTPRDIIVGKLSAGSVTIAPMLCGVLTASLTLLFTGAYTWRLLFTGFTSLILCAALSVCIGLYASLLTKRTSTALVLSYVLAITLFAGSPILQIVTGMPEGGHSLVVRFCRDLFYHVMPYFGSPIQVFVNIVSWRRRGAAPSLFPWVFDTIFYSLLCVALIRKSIRVFQQRRMRDE